MTQVYRVSFFKRLSDSTGHQVNACQGTVEVHAPSEDRAIEIARTRFAERKAVCVWSLRADYEETELLPASQWFASPSSRKSRQEVLVTQ